MTSERDEYDVTVTVFCRTRGGDYADAASVASAAVRRALEAPGVVHLPFHDGVRLPVVVGQVMETGMAVGNGYLWLEPTIKGFREYRMPELPPDETGDASA